VFLELERILSVLYTIKKERTRQVFKFVFIRASVAIEFERITNLASISKLMGLVWYQNKFVFIRASVAIEFEGITNLASISKLMGIVW